jgi:hypothetical protein
MTPGKTEALSILILLLPGFVCAYVTQRLAVRKAQTEAEKIIEALILSFILYLVTLPFFQYTLPLSWKNEAGIFTIVPHFPYLLTLLASSIVLGVLYSANINNDWLMIPLRWLGVTDKTARSSIWNDAFQEIGRGWVQVGFKDGSQLIGWVRYSSDDPREASLFLEDAAWWDGRTETPVPGDGILILRNAAIETITFLDQTTRP